MLKRKTQQMKYDILSLSAAVVTDENQNKIQMHRLWRRRSAIFVFLRHFSCIACRAHALEVWNNRADYQKNGGLIYFIGNGNPENIASFKADLKLEGALIFTDPTLTSFRAAGLKRGMLSTLGPEAVTNVLSLLSQGHVQKEITKGVGDLWQMGGILVLQTDGRVTYQYVSESLGDFPPEEDRLLIAEAGRRATVSASIQR